MVRVYSGSDRLSAFGDGRPRGTFTLAPMAPAAVKYSLGVARNSAVARSYLGAARLSRPLSSFLLSLIASSEYCHGCASDWQAQNLC